MVHEQNFSLLFADLTNEEFGHRKKMKLVVCVNHQLAFGLLLSSCWGRQVKLTEITFFLAVNSDRITTQTEFRFLGIIDS